MKLRLATMADAGRLLAWRNDPATRANSRHQDLVTPEAHRAWLERSLADPARDLFVAESDDGAVLGTGRLDWTGSEAEVSLTLDAGARACALATPLILALCDQARLRGATRIWADVQAENVASWRAFHGAWFVAQTIRMERTVEGSASNAGSAADRPVVDESRNAAPASGASASKGGNA